MTATSKSSHISVRERHGPLLLVSHWVRAIYSSPGESELVFQNPRQMASVRSYLTGRTLSPNRLHVPSAKPNLNSESSASNFSSDISPAEKFYQYSLLTPVHSRSFTTNDELPETLQCFDPCHPDGLENNECAFSARFHAIFAGPLARLRPWRADSPLLARFPTILFEKSPAIVSGSRRIEKLTFRSSTSRHHSEITSVGRFSLIWRDLDNDASGLQINTVRSRFTNASANERSGERTPQKLRLNAG